MQLEMRFILNKVVDDELRYYYVVTALDDHYAAEVIDNIKKPPAQDRCVFELDPEMILRPLKEQIVN
ncbi:UNVERIFIED_CONTAM: hypothetical protein PYX00_005471 [Menopon gallinae]|uniref:DUF7041 domain-containing protein n=1 Tax=Menopon gallinae TaxID=328185 RepID=A0AAW2HRB8_9NEOP